MTRLIKAAFFVAIATTSVSANAFWGPFGNSANGMGDGAFDFSMNMSAQGNGWNRHMGGYHPYRGHPFAYGQPDTATPEARQIGQTPDNDYWKVIAERQRTFTEQQAKRFEEAMQAQRQRMEQLSSRQDHAFRGPSEIADDFVQFKHPYGSNREEMQKIRDEMRQSIQDRREEMLKRVEEQRKAAEKRHAAIRKAMGERSLQGNV